MVISYLPQPPPFLGHLVNGLVRSDLYFAYSHCSQMLHQHLSYKIFVLGRHNLFGYNNFNIMALLNIYSCTPISNYPSPGNMGLCRTIVSSLSQVTIKKIKFACSYTSFKQGPVQWDLTPSKKHSRKANIWINLTRQRTKLYNFKNLEARWCPMSKDKKDINKIKGSTNI